MQRKLEVEHWRNYAGQDRHADAWNFCNQDEGQRDLQDEQYRSDDIYILAKYDFKYCLSNQDFRQVYEDEKVKDSEAQCIFEQCKPHNHAEKKTTYGQVNAIDGEVTSLDYAFLHSHALHDQLNHVFTRFISGF